MTDVAAAPPPVAATARAHEAAQPVRGRSGWPLPLPTRRAAACLAGAALVTGCGALHPAVGFAGLALCVVVLVVVLVDFAALPRADELVAVRTGRPVLPLGAADDVVVEVSLRGGRHGGGRTWRAELVDDLHAAIERSAEPPPGRLGPGLGARFATPVRCTRRGRFALGAAHLRLRGALGLAERETRFELPLTVRVVPGLAELAEAAKVLRRAAQREAGLRRARLRGQGTSFESLREYARGDDPRHVDWKASARHAKLMCRRYEVERSQTVMFLVDAGRWMTSEVDGLTRLDRVLNAALLLAHVATRRDDRVGALVFADEVLRFVPPGKGRAGVERILEAVFDVEPRLVESDYRAAFAQLAARHRKRSLLVLFTDVLARDQSRILIEEVSRSVVRHLPLAVTLRDPAIDALAARVPSNAAAAYEQAAAEELLLEREQALARLRAGGVNVLDVAPALLASSVVDRYLELKARMLL